jgi:phosphate-selective porin OprO/OprP
MRRLIAMSLLASTMMASPQIAGAQESDSAALRAELEAMRGQMAAMQARLDALEKAEAEKANGERAAANSASPSAAAAPEATAAAEAVLQAAKPAKADPSAIEVKWRGAPEISTADGWSFKPRGRIQLDLTAVNTPPGVTEDRGGLRTEARRLYLGVDGKMPGGFAYRLEVDVANGIELTDAYLTYGTGPLTVVAGQVKTFWGLEEMTSDLLTSMMERSMISQAFGFERRVGLSGEYNKGDIFVQGGVFSAAAEDLTDDTNNAIAADLRAVWHPKLSDQATLHLGGHVHMRNLNDPEGRVRYRARPGAHTTDMRLVDTGDIDARGERSAGFELALQNGPFHATTEGYWQKVLRVGGPNPTFFGGYAEVGMVLTKGDKRSYRGGVFDRLRPSNPISKGGWGAFEVNARYDHLDLNDQDIVGGKQKAAWLSLVWVPIDYVRMTANYGKLWISDAQVAAADGDRNYGADSFGLRTQIDF